MQISIAMCTYNGAAFLLEQLESIAAQTLLPDELVLCDDGSTDRTVEIAKAFAKTASFSFRIVENTVNLGYSRNFDQAVQMCSNEIIALADQDDLWYPEKLAILHQLLSEDETLGAVFSNGDLIDSRSNPLGQSLWERFRFDANDQVSFSNGGAIDVLLRRNVVTGMTFAFRRSMKPLLTSVPRSWIHDGWLALQIARQSRVFAEPARLVGYRIHGAQQVGTPASAAGKLHSIRSNGFGAFVEAIHARNLDEYERTLVQYEDLVEFLKSEEGVRDEELITKAEAKAAFARRGATALAMPRMKRWRLLSSHLESYRRFSPTGLRGLVRDLCI